MSSDVIRILLVCDNYFYRLGLKTELEMSGQYIVNNELDSLLDTEIDFTSHCDLMLLCLDSINMLNSIKTFQSKRNKIPILTLIKLVNTKYIRRIIKSGVSGVLYSNCAPDVLLDAVHSCIKGITILDPHIDTSVLSDDIDKNPLWLLTSRELDVLHDLSQGKTNKKIAISLNMSEQTVKSHMRNILRKLNVNSRLEAAMFWSKNNTY
ncbi:response regulator transcription factor [Escherichia coli]|uniref:response regulator transcription factor n=1 Tax=Escherichia coli TaxID=562 RepID=UPI000BE792C8|nr:response regulator transcription factor [Escherichia coli]